MFYVVKTPAFIRQAFPDAWWRLEYPADHVYLTFDDGPTQEVTPWVLDALDAADAKATFFLQGSQVEKHPGIALEILNRGHAVGHHGYAHLNAWKTKTDVFLTDIGKGASLTPSPLFRPPYGKLTPDLYRSLKHQYQVVLWDVMPGDFDKGKSAVKCLKDALRHTQSGSIVVLHDNAKSFPKLKEMLPDYLAGLKEKGFRLAALPQPA
ncbi:MAG: polysaccharide deacetylase family protein [Flavobacteriales bacterium]|nr:polysaccharide deacetylase family protein [Flavobacteriales bacterium]MCB9449337.1 polysaccharide deacetylase family protein [Flavobacteriales bacterium]